MSKPKGSAAVLQKVFGEDAGAKAAQNLQKATQISLPKVPASAKVPGRITESEQLRCAPDRPCLARLCNHHAQQDATVMCRGDALRIDITRQLVPSYFNLVRRNLTDGVPKAIMLCLVNEVKEQMQARPPRQSPYMHCRVS